MNSKLFSALVVLSVHVIVMFLSLSILLPGVHADSVIATVPVNQHPLDFAFNTANNQVYLGHASTSLMSVIDGQSNGIIKIIPISNTYFYGLAYNPTNQHVYVANDTGPVGSVAVIDPSTDTLIKSVPVGDSPVQTLYNPFNGFIYVTDTNSQRVEIIDASTNTVIKTIPVGIHPIGMAYNANNNNVYVANSNQFSSSVSVIDSTSNSVIKTIPIPGSPWRIAFNSNNGNMYVTLIGAKNVAVIDGSTNTVIKTIPMPVFPPYPGSPFTGTSVGSIVYNPFNNFVYVSHMNSEYVTGIDAATDTVTKTIKVGHYPFTIGYHSTNHNIYVANHDSNTVSVIGTANTTTTSQAVCPEEDVNHWDKIEFMIMSPVLAEKVHVLPFTELDIKVLDNPKQVADLKQKVLNFLRVPNEFRNSIKIINVDYAIICATKGPVVLYPQKEPVLNQSANTTTMKIPTNATMPNSTITNKSSSINTTIPEQVPPQSINGSKVAKI